MFELSACDLDVAAGARAVGLEPIGRPQSRRPRVSSDPRSTPPAVGGSVRRVHERACSGRHGLTEQTGRPAAPQIYQRPVALAGSPTTAHAAPEDASSTACPRRTSVLALLIAALRSSGGISWSAARISATFGS